MKNMKNNIKKTIIWLIAMCMLLPMTMPLLVLADDGNWNLTVGEKTNALSVAPYENDLGLMVNAEDLTKALSLDYEFDSQNKCFTIHDDVLGKIILMHNATQFYSDDKIYDCAPYFYIENGVPMVEANFFCNVLGASIDCNEDKRKLIITKNETVENSSPLSEESNPALAEAAEISLYASSPALSGRIYIENSKLIPTSGIDVDLILQTRSSIYTWTSVYGVSHSGYNIGETYTLGTTHISKEKGYGEYSYSLARYYTDRYPLYTLFYSSTDNDFLEPFGYYVNSSTIQPIDTPAMYSYKEYLDSRGFDLKSSSYAYLTLPEKSSRPKKPITQLKANIDSGYVAEGTVITLSCETANAQIYYTTDGTPPSRSSLLYTSGGITVDRPITIKAIAITPQGDISDIVTYTYTTAIPANALITVDNSVGKPGQTVDVEVSLSNNPGIASMRLNVGYDSNALTLVGVADFGKLGRQLHADNYGQNPYTLCWNNSLTADYTADGNVVTLKFKINDNAPEGDYPITVSYDNTNDDIFNANLEPVEFSITDGKVIVSETAPNTLVNAEFAECKFTDNTLSAEIEFYSCLTDCAAILAVYDSDGRLLKILAQAVSAGETSTKFELTSDNNFAGKDVKAFFWESLDAMKPIGKALKCTVVKQ